MKNYYRYLNLRDGASIEEVKKQLRKLSIEFHPDKNKGDLKAEKRYKEISEAYNYLKDPSRKARLDAYLVITRASHTASQQQKRQEPHQSQHHEKKYNTGSASSGEWSNSSGYTYTESRDKRGYREVEDPFDFSEIKMKVKHLLRDNSFWLKLSMGVGIFVIIQMNKREPFPQIEHIKTGKVNIIRIDTIGNVDTLDTMD